MKVLDFGLAKLTDRGPVPDTGDDRTRTIANVAPMTVEGSILGTVSYMSPEQAQGKKVDTRSDIFSFGAVLYEMATGVRAFEGESSLSTLSAILRDEVKPMSEVAPDVPPQLETVIQRCLRKLPGRPLAEHEGGAGGALGVEARVGFGVALHHPTDGATAAFGGSTGVLVRHSRGCRARGQIFF